MRVVYNVHKVTNINQKLIHLCVHNSWLSVNLFIHLCVHNSCLSVNLFIHEFTALVILLRIGSEVKM